MTRPRRAALRPVDRDARALLVVTLAGLLAFAAITAVVLIFGGVR